MDLSILVPGIRTKNWLKLYDSVANSTSRSWEIVFVGPYDLPKELNGFDNIKYIKDFGSPIRCQQMALINSTGEWINWAADDGFFIKDSLDIGFSKLEEVGYDYKTIVMGKYHEGDGDCSHMSEDHYYKLNSHGATYSKFIDDTYFTLNVGLVSSKLLREVGGWDCQFEVCPMSYADAAIRLRRHGAKFIVQDELMFSCGHMPGTSGDHGPIHWAQITHDEPLYRTIWNDYNLSKDRCVVDINNWNNQPKVWSRRFSC